MLFGFILKSSCKADIVQELMNRYNDVSFECLNDHGVAKPLYECSGIIIRGVRLYKNERKFPWSLKPSDKKMNSVPFAYLRKDFPFSRIFNAYEAGFILYPYLKTPAKKNTQQVLCAYPINALTDWREERGCGRSYLTDETGSSRPCHTQNITTFTDWLAHSNKIQQRLFRSRQCGFNTSNEKTAVQNFAVTMQGNKYLQTVPEFDALYNNEMRLEAWNENHPEQIPIQTFFYFVDSVNDSQLAKKYRDDFYAQTGEKVPIVGIRLPTKENHDIHIESIE